MAQAITCVGQGLTNILDISPREAEGQWWFEDGEHYHGEVDLYVSRALNLGKHALFQFVKLIWKDYMRVGIEAVKERTEREAL